MRRRVLINGSISWLFTAAGNAAAYSAYRPFVPPMLLHGWGLFVLALLAWFGFLVVTGWLWPQRLNLGQIARRRTILENWTWAVAMGAIWLLMPYGSVELQFVTLLFVACYAATSVLSAADAPRGLLPRILIVLGSVIAVVVLCAMPYWPFLASFLAIFALALAGLSRLIERNLSSLAEARAAAERALAVRTRFLAAASHDLGQPLHSARLFLDQAVRARDETARAYATGMAGTSLAATERMVRSMLDHLRLDAAEMRPQIAPMALNDVIASVTAQFEPVARLASARLVAVSTSARVAADPQLLERALSNLVDNGLRHGGARRILIGVRRHGPRVRLWVIDDGAGIADADAGHLFEDFVQGSAEPGRERGGFGLGLASARRIMRLMAGDAGMRREVRRGAAFFLELVPM